MPKETYQSAYSLAKEAELHLQLLQKCLRSLDVTINDALPQATSLIENISAQSATSLSATAELANELRGAIAKAKLSEQMS
ncbi:hypothetical protein [Vibrio ezurae]|uniref:Uncharacterized protein n=1 Tax=Vibrio ezurae NBRC 102218 TaxID=1219080 RepID=U3AJG1_9VIBR|nr:hypothetical protein [Vibrio ezurae]GAD80066.1 hypothetical protein VEZ01S_23_00180 [Vibrio ezurae NBRC 102218]